MLRKSITRKITTSIIDEKRVESFNLLIKAKQKEKKSIKYLFHNQESMSIILYILSKNKRTSRDIYILNSFLKTQKQFMQIVQEEEESLDKEEILTKITNSLKFVIMEAQTFLIKVGNKGNKFYIILHGNVSVLVPKTINLKMKYEQYCHYLQFLYFNKENYLLEKTINYNISKFKVNKDIYTQPIENNLIFNKNNKLNIPIDEYISYINGEKDINETSQYFDDIQIEGYIKIIELKEGETFGEIALLNDNHLRTATIFVNKYSLFGILKGQDYKSTIKIYQQIIKRNNITFILSLKLFDDIPINIFINEYWNYFTKLNLNKGDFLFKDNDKGEKIYFLYKGEIELKTKLNFKKINQLISYFGNYKLKTKDMKEKGENEYVTLSIAKKGDLLGLSDNLFEGKFFCSAIILSEKVQIFAIDKILINSIWKENNIINTNYKILEEKKVKFMLDRLLNIKKTYLSNMIGEFRDKNEGLIKFGNNYYNIKTFFKSNEKKNNNSNCKLNLITINNDLKNKIFKTKFKEKIKIKKILKLNQSEFFQSRINTSKTRSHSRKYILNLSQKNISNSPNNINNNLSNKIIPYKIFISNKNNFSIRNYNNDANLIRNRIHSSHPRNLKKQLCESLPNKHIDDFSLSNNNNYIYKKIYSHNYKKKNKTFYNYVDFLIMDKSLKKEKNCIESYKPKKRNLKKTFNTFVPINYLPHAKPLKIFIDKSIEKTIQLNSK